MNLTKFYVTTRRRKTAKLSRISSLKQRQKFIALLAQLTTNSFFPFLLGNSTSKIFVISIICFKIFQFVSVETSDSKIFLNR